MRNVNEDNLPIEITLQMQLAVREQSVLAHGIPLRTLKMRIRREEITQPPPKYWEKINCGLSRNQALREIGWTPPMIRKINDILRDAKSQTIKPLCKAQA